MSAKRGASGLSGVLLVDKPAGLTSHDVVSRVRRVCGEKRVGHAGTLDPLATGLLVVLVGPATRLEPYLSAASKSYDARIAFGAATDTDDSEGSVVRECEVPDALFDGAYAREALEALLGESLQRPPAYSAIKVGGQTAHRVARAGGTMELAERPIVVREARLLGMDAGDRTWDVAFTVSKGTYIRALARDLGERLGTAAHLSGLRRTACGDLRVDDALTLDSIEEAGAEGAPGLFADPVAALALSTYVVTEVDVANGRPLVNGAAAVEDGDRVVVVTDSHLLGIYRSAGADLRAEVLLSTPIERRS